jgi:hypothetical protein
MCFSRLGNDVKVRSLRTLVQTNRHRLWAKGVGQNNQAMRMAKSELSTHDASDGPPSPSSPMRTSKVRSLRSQEGIENGAVLDFGNRALFNSRCESDVSTHVRWIPES